MCGTRLNLLREGDGRREPDLPASRTMRDSAAASVASFVWRPPLHGGDVSLAAASARNRRTSSTRSKRSSSPGAWCTHRPIRTRWRCASSRACDSHSLSGANHQKSPPEHFADLARGDPGLARRCRGVILVHAAAVFSISTNAMTRRSRCHPPLGWARAFALIAPLSTLQQGVALEAVPLMISCLHNVPSTPIRLSTHLRLARAEVGTVRRSWGPWRCPWCPAAPAQSGGCRIAGDETTLESN